MYPQFLQITLQWISSVSAPQMSHGSPCSSNGICVLAVAPAIRFPMANPRLEPFRGPHNGGSRALLLRVNGGLKG